MSRRSNKKLSRISPQIVIVGALLAIVALAGLALMFTKSEPETSAAAVVPRAARVERVEGEVGIARAFADEQESETVWTDATINAPLTVGDRIYAKDGSRATLAFSGRNYARLDPGASLDVLSLADRRTQLALRNGSAIFDLGDLSQDDFFEVATPNGAVEFDEPGLYQVGFDEGGNTLISVLSGLAQVVGLSGSGEVGKGEILTLLGQTAAQAIVSRISPDRAGGIVDDYYDYRYEDEYDGRYRDYDVYLDDPDYYDPYARSASYQYVNSYDVTGLDDLDDYGDWVDVDGYGRCWTPRVDAGWAPYRQGSWDIDNVWGPTWVSDEPWGWAPYHYGRWANVNNQRWVWVPDRASSHPVYSPALVAFVPVRQTNQIAWVPLAPGEQYLPRYYNSGYEPQYIGSVDVVNQYVRNRRTYVNLNVPQAVTVVPVQHFTDGIRSGSVSYLNPQYVGQAQPVIDPYAVDGMRQIAIDRRGGKFNNRKGFKVGREFDRVLNTPVVTSVAPVVPPTRASLASGFQVRPASEKQRKNKLKFERNGQVASEVRATRGDGVNYQANPQAVGSVNVQERSQRKAALAAQVTQGDQTARRELKQIRRQEKQERRGVVSTQQNQAAGQQTRQERKSLRRLDRQQQPVPSNVPQKHGGNASQSVNPRKLERQQMRQQRRQGAQSTGQSVAPQQQQIREQRKAQRQAERQQRRPVQNVFAAPQQNSQQVQIQQQRKAERQAARQQRRMQQPNVYVAPQATQQKQQTVIQQAEKAQRKAARQQAAQQRVASPQMPAQVYRQQPAAQPAAQNNREQRKAEKAARKAARGNQ